MSVIRLTKEFSFEASIFWLTFGVVVADLV